MKLMKKLGGLTLALALCAGLLAGCGNAADKAADTAAEEVQETQEVQEAAGTGEEAQEAETETAQEDASDFDAAALTEALNDVCSVGPGAAGSELRAVKAAGELVNFAALNWNDEDAEAIGDAVAAWFEDLEEEEKEEFQLGREMVEGQAEAIAATPTSTDLLGLMSDAGLEYDLAALDLSHTGDLLQAIRENTGAVAESN